MGRKKADFGFCRYGKVYYLWFWDQGTRRKVSTGHTAKGAASIWAKKYFEDRVNKGPDRITLREFAAPFFEPGCKWMARRAAQGHRLSSPVAKSRRQHLDNYLIPEFGDKPLRDLSARELSDFLISLDISNQTRNHILYTIRIVLDEAVFRDVIRANPAKSIQPFAVNARKRSILTKDEIEKLFGENSLDLWGETFYQVFFLTALTTGMREGELRALTWGAIDWDLSAISVLRAVKGDGTIGSTKSGECRAVIVPRRTLDALRRWQTETPANAINDLVFFAGNGYSPASRRTLLTHWKKGLKDAEIDTTDRDLCIHSLRHTYNTIMRDRIPEEMLRYMVGHKTQAMSDRYDQATPIDRLRAMLPEKIDEVF